MTQHYVHHNYVGIVHLRSVHVKIDMVVIINKIINKSSYDSVVAKTFYTMLQPTER